jgi:hypothetical protein
VAARDGYTHVTLIVRNAPPGESLDARIRSGTCENPGAAIARLDPVDTDQAGQGHSETSVGAAPQMILDGSHIAAVYGPDADTERDRPLACAALPAQGTAQQPGATEPGATRP